jgi:SnoaL-like domain
MSVRQASPVRRTVEDRLAIQDVVVRYGYVLDDQAWDALGEVFTDEAVVDFRDHGSNPPRGLAPFVGLDEIRRYFSEILTHPYQHMVVNHMIEDVSDDEAVVRSKTLCPVPGRMVTDIEYRDVVVRTPAGWRIKEKTTKRYNPEPSPWAVEQFAIWKERGAQVDG